jgi:hypothetical protein
VRTDRYKLIRFYGDMELWELYDLTNDPHELSNVYGQPGYETVQEDMHRRLRAVREQLGDSGGS